MKITDRGRTDKVNIYIYSSFFPNNECKLLHTEARNRSPTTTTTASSRRLCSGTRWSSSRGLTWCHQPGWALPQVTFFCFFCFFFSCFLAENSLKTTHFFLLEVGINRRNKGSLSFILESYLPGRECVFFLLFLTGIVFSWILLLSRSKACFLSFFFKSFFYKFPSLFCIESCDWGPKLSLDILDSAMSSELVQKYILGLLISSAIWFFLMPQPPKPSMLEVST